MKFFNSVYSFLKNNYFKYFSGDDEEIIFSDDISMNMNTIRIDLIDKKIFLYSIYNYKTKSLSYINENEILNIIKLNMNHFEDI